MDIQQLKSDVAKYEKRLSNELLSNDEKEFAQKKLDLSKKALSDAESALPEEKDTKKSDVESEKSDKVEKATVAKRGRKPKAKTDTKAAPAVKGKKGRASKPEKTDVKKTVKKEPAAQKSVVKKTKVNKKLLTVTYKGKEYNENDENFCEILIESMKARKAAIKKANRKYKSVSISTKIGTGIADAVEKAIHAVDKQQVKDKPDVFIVKFVRLQKAADEFIKSFRSILGSDYDAEDIKKPMDEITALVNKLKENYKTKKK